MRHSLRSTLISFLLIPALAGCDVPAEPLSEASQAYAIGPRDRPEALFAGASRRLADTISAGDVGKDFGVPTFRAPYPDTYWPFKRGGTDARWNPGGIDSRTPLEKYMWITDPYSIDFAKAWEFTHHGPGAPGVKDWCGHCTGWAAAAMSHAPIRHAVNAGPDGFGGIAPCNPGDYGCVRFEIGDINALMAEIYLDGLSYHIGTTCNTPGNAIPRDRYGRVMREGCAGVNAGSLLVAAATLLKKNQIPFAINAQTPGATDEIWNQPTYRYHVYDYHPITAAEAANLVARGATTGPETVYRWNAAARGFAFVDLGLRFVGEEGPHVVMRTGDQSTYEMRVAAVIELSADASDPRSTIVGGEYLDLPSSGSNRLAVTPFLWVALGSGPEVLSPYASSSHHNPFVRPSVVKQLIALGQQ